MNDHHDSRMWIAPIVRVLRRVAVVSGLAMIAMIAGACSDLLDVEAPSRIEAETFDDPSVASLLVASAISDFECAFAEYIVGAGLVGEELDDSQLASAMWPYDQRQWDADNNGQYATASCEDGAIGIYTPLSTVRWQADNALENLQQWTDEQVLDRTELIAQAAAYAGYSYTLLGEAMCSAAFDLGPELSRAEIFERAEDRFTLAIETASELGADEIADEIMNMAHVGRARARLNLDRPQDAAADARLVREGFVRHATYSGTSPRRENDIFTRNIREGGVTVGPPYRGLEFGGTPDARVTVRYAGISTADNITDLWIQDKFTSVDASIPIASWDEAQLIIAEAELGQTAVDIINTFHDRADLPHFSSDNAAEIQAHVIEERRRELFLESHHLGDKIRHDLPFLPVPGTPYPPKAGGFYGDMTCFPLPEVERSNNPGIGG